MSSWRAILWLEWRLVRRDVAVLAGVAALAPPLLDDALPPTAGLALLTSLLVPVSASALGAGLGAAETGLAFLHLRAADWRRVVAGRLGLRCLASLAVAVAGLTSLLAFSPDGELAGELIASRPIAWIAGAVLVAGFTAAGVTAAAFSRTALAAVVPGWALFSLLLTALTMALVLIGVYLPSAFETAWLKELGLSAVPVVGGLLALAVAQAIASLRTDREPLDARALVSAVARRLRPKRVGSAAPATNHDRRPRPR